MKLSKDQIDDLIKVMVIIAKGVYDDNTDTSDDGSTYLFLAKKEAEELLSSIEL